MNTNDKRVLLRRGCEARQLSGGGTPWGAFQEQATYFYFKLLSYVAPPGNPAGGLRQDYQPIK